MSALATVRALYRFFSGFGWPVYPEDNVPPEAEPPYITVRLIAPNWRETAPFFARLWARGAGYEAILAKADEIGNAIGEGASVPAGGGCVVIGRERDFAQIMPFQGDVTLKCVYLSMNLQALN